MWVLLKLKNNNEILSLKTFGFSNAKFVYLLSISSFFVGVFILLALNPITSVMVKYYEDIKGSYDIDKSHLSSITNNGVWIKENIGTNENQTFNIYLFDVGLLNTKSKKTKIKKIDFSALHSVTTSVRPTDRPATQNVTFLCNARKSIFPK